MSSHQAPNNSWVWALLVSTVVVGAYLSRGPGSQPAAPVTYDAAARSACQTFIGRLLHDPQSVQWDEPWSWTTVENSDGTWSVGARFSARNGFGGMRKEYRTCVMSHKGDDWSLISAAKMN